MRLAGAVLTFAAMSGLGMGSVQSVAASPSSAECDGAVVEELYVSANGLWPFKYRLLASYLEKFELCQLSFHYDHVPGTAPNGTDITVPWFVEVNVRSDGDLQGCILHRQAAAPPPSRDGLCFEDGRLVPAR